MQGSEILAVGPRVILEKKYPDALHRHFSSSVILPGFVNAHVHTATTRWKGAAREKSFAPWLKKMVDRVRQKQFSPQDYLASARQGVKECLRSGVTTAADSGPFANSIRALEESGLRGIFYLEIFSLAQKTKNGLVRRTLKKIKTLQNSVSPRIKIGISPHSPYTAAPWFLQEITRDGVRRKIPIALHVAESREEVQFFQNGDGALPKIFPGREKMISRARSPVAYLENLGALCHGLLAAHCVHTDAKDRRLLKSRGVKVAVCPASNARLKVGTAPVRDFLKRGIKVGLGTDSAASAGSLDYFSALRDAVRAYRLTPAQVLWMATLDGACALGLEREIGSLEPGKKADLLVISLKGFERKLFRNPISVLIQKASSENVLMVMVDGRILIG